MMNKNVPKTIALHNIPSSFFLSNMLCMAFFLFNFDFAIVAMHIFFRNSKLQTTYIVILLEWDNRSSGSK